MTVILTAKFVVPIRGGCIEDGAVAIDGSVISAIGKADDLRSKFQVAGTEDFGKAAILPGFVNCHSHLEITASADGMVATAMRCVNAIPFVVDAPPGLVSSLDLPQTSADALVARGVEVRHIMTAREAPAHELTPFGRVEAGRVTYPALL